MKVSTGSFFPARFRFEVMETQLLREFTDCGAAVHGAEWLIVDLQLMTSFEQFNTNV